MADGRTVKKRRVFYIPGYDPFHPRRYRELYRKESATQAEISGYEISLAARKGKGPYGWQVTTRFEGATIKTEFDVLIWSDIVKTSMTLNIPMTYWVLIRTAWTYVASGAFSRLLRTRKGPVIAALYPIAMLLLQLVIALLVGWAGGALAGMLQVWAFWPMFLVTLIMVLRGFRQIDNRLFAYYLMHDYAYSAQSEGANPPELEARMAEFGERIARALGTGVDEVLVVGHSSGAHLGVSVLADLIRAGRVPGDGPALSFLTLGQVVPMVSFLRHADRLRGDLAYMAAQGVVPWVDVTAPGDGCAFALCDPVAVTGVAPEDKRWPLVFSAAFTQSLSAERWKALRWRFFRLHFQYLCAFDRPRDYDYFKITAGPQTLWGQYQGRPPSPSRKITPLSKFRGTGT